MKDLVRSLKSQALSIELYFVFLCKQSYQKRVSLPQRWSKKLLKGRQNDCIDLSLRVSPAVNINSLYLSSDEVISQEKMHYITL